jgi:cytochrome c
MRSLSGVMPSGAALLALAVIGLAIAGCTGDTQTASAITGGDAFRGREAIRRYGCTTCHSIPGVPGATGTVGPPLDKIARRTYVAGRLENTPANLQRFIRHPQQVDPPNAMPDVGVTEADGRDIAAYLYTLK